LMSVPKRTVFPQLNLLVKFFGMFDNRFSWQIDFLDQISPILVP